MDAVSYQSLQKLQTLKDILIDKEHLLIESFSPSSVTGSALPSLLTSKPFFTHLLGDYEQWFYSQNLECLSFQNKTIVENFKHFIDYSEAYTSFSKTMPFYGYYRGFDYFYNRCSGNNYCPSAIDIFNNRYDSNRNFYSTIGTKFTFIHDIGGHPPVIPKIDYSDKNKHEHISYLSSVESSLIKIKNLLIKLDSEKALEKTNIIITGDHTDSFSFNKNKFNLYPSRISVPFLFIPAKELDIKIFEYLVENKQKLPSTYVLSEILKNIYSTEFKHPEFSIKEINWLSRFIPIPKRLHLHNWI